jgi:uncharacterized surface protein with fasciclin (FAS1) repeats
MNLWSDAADLANVLEYHVIDGVVERADFNGLTATVQGTLVDLTNSGSNSFANDEPIMSNDHQASNGVAHGIQGVLYLPDTCMTEMMCEDNEECIQGACRVRAPETIWSRVERLEKFSVFKELVLGAGNDLDTFLALESPFFALYPDVTPEECEVRTPPCGITAFIPTNSAFDGVDIPTLLADEDLGYRLDHHILPGIWQSEDLNLVDGQTIDSIMSRPVEFTWDIAGFLIEGQLATAVDVTATNGIMHELSSFLELPTIPGPCESTMPLTLDGPTVTGTTAGRASLHTSQCGGSGGELAYEIVATDYQRGCASVQPTDDSDPLVHVREAVCTASMAELSCLDDNNYPADLGAKVDFEMVAGQSYFVMVDAFFAEGNGEFELSLTSGPCDNPPVENLSGVINDNEQYSRFAALLPGTSFEATFASESIHSAFIPTNDALAALETGMPALWTVMTSPERIESFIGAHLVAGRYAPGRLSNVNSLTMVNTQTFELFDTGAGIDIGGVLIIETGDSPMAPMEATNGLVYGVDGVLMPEITCAEGCPTGLVCDVDDLCAPPPPVGSCDNPEVLVPFTMGQLSAYSGDTSANLSNTAGSCGEPGSPDHVFSVSITPQDCVGADGSCPVCLSTAAVACGFDSPFFPFLQGPCASFAASPLSTFWPFEPGFNDVGTTFDTIIRVHEQSCLGAEIACEENTYQGIRGSAVTVDMTPNQNYFVVVDGQSPGLFGQFNLAVRAGACP